MTDPQGGAPGAASQPGQQPQWTPPPGAPSGQTPGGYAQPAGGQPPYTQPGYGQPGYGQPGAGQVPPYAQPGYGPQGHQGYAPPPQGGADQIMNFGVQQPGGPVANIPTPSGLDFMGAVKTVLGKYADFNGRATRSEFWFWYLAYAGGLFVLWILGLILSSAIGWGMFAFFIVIISLVSLAAIVPTIAVGVRRMHDTGRSGLFLLVSFIPFVGGIIVIVLCAQPSQPYGNQYGLPAA